MRREGRRPTVPLQLQGESSGDWEIPAKSRPASSIARSGERKRLEETAIREALVDQIEHWKRKQDWLKIMVAESLFVGGWANKEVAESLSLTEQQVANYKFEFIAKMRSAIKKQSLSEDVFPELSVEDQSA